MRTVLLTGATGFVGSNIFKALFKLNAQIIPVVRSGKESSLQNHPSVSRIVSSPDIFQENADWWAEQFRGVDVVIHSAWYTEPGKYLQSPKNLDCLIGSMNFAKGVVSAGVRRFVGVGTCFEYDLTSGLLSKDTPLNPLTPYAGAKAALYMGLSRLLPERSVEFAWCRLFYLYGEGEDERRLVSYLHRQLSRGKEALLSSGEQVRDYVDVSIAGWLIAKIALSAELGPINICSGIPRTVRQVAEQVADEYERRDLLKFGERIDNVINPPCVLGIPNQCVTSWMSSKYS